MTKQYIENRIVKLKEKLDNLLLEAQQLTKEADRKKQEALRVDGAIDELKILNKDNGINRRTGKPSLSDIQR